VKSKRILVASGLLAATLIGTGTWFLANHHSPGKTALANTAEILHFGPRPPASNALKLVRQSVSAKLSASGWIVTEQSFERFTPVGTVRFTNLRARFPNPGETDPWPRPVDGILSAHIDSKPSKDNLFVGADDSASCVGAILEVARILASSHPDQARRMELVFFDGEESLSGEMTEDEGPIPKDGLWGSRAYANLWRNAASKPRFGILLDMVGHKNLAIRLPGDTPTFLKTACLGAAAKESADNHFAMSSRATIGDDHVPLNLAGIPSIDVCGNYGEFPWWHTPGDNLENLSAESLDISVRVTVDMIGTLLENPAN
jgi:glutaminyl-peptide cyclotransferase